MLGRDGRDEFLNQDGFADTCTAEKSDLAALCIRGQKVDDLDARFENFRRGALFGECGRFAVDAVEFPRHLAFAVYGFAERIHDAPDDLLADGHHDARSRRFNLQSARKPFRGLQRDTAAHAAGTVRKHFDVYLSVPVQNVQKLVLIGKVIVELDVHDRTDNLYDCSDILFFHKLPPLEEDALEFMSSFVIPSCRLWLYSETSSSMSLFPFFVDSCMETMRL